MDPAGGLAQACAQLAGTPLQQQDLACGRLGLRANAIHAAAHLGRITDAPFGAPRLQIQRGRMAIQCEELRHIKADAARADNRHTLTHRFAMAQHVDVRQHARMVLPWNLRIARRNARRDDDLVVLARQQLLRVNACAEAQRDAGGLYAACEVAHHLVEFFLARNRLGHVQLAADFRCSVVQVHRMAALGQRDRC